jgi:hypothetical protein
MAYSGMTEAQEKYLFHVIKTYTLLKITVLSGREELTRNIESRLIEGVFSGAFRQKQQFLSFMQIAEAMLKSCKTWNRVSETMLMTGISELEEHSKALLDPLKPKIKELFQAWCNEKRKKYFQYIESVDELSAKSMAEDPLIMRAWGARTGIESGAAESSSSLHAAPAKPSQPSWATVLCRFFCCGSSTSESPPTPRTRLLEQGARVTMDAVV